MRLEKYTGEVHQKRQSIVVVLIIALSALLTSGFSYFNWNSTYGGWIFNVIAIILVFYLFTHWPKNRRYNFKIEVLLLTFIPFLSIINSHSIYGQGFIDSSRALAGVFFWVIYFMLHKYKVEEYTILKSFFIISLFVVAVQVIQQFTYPNAIFGIMSMDEIVEKGLTEIAEKRNGIWRFRIGENAYFTTPILFFALSIARKKLNLKISVVIALLLVSVYLTLTRQVIAACLLAIFLSFFLGKKNKGFIRAIIIGFALLALLYGYSDILFGSLAEQTQDDMTDSNIRLIAANYFWNESTKDPLTFLFGYGLPGQNGAYAQLTKYNQQTLNYFTVDVGFIGKLYEFGAIYVLICYYVLLKIFFKLKKVVPLYMRMFVIFTGAMSIMIFPMASTLYYFIWACMLYICDLHINKDLEYKKIRSI